MRHHYCCRLAVWSCLLMVGAVAAQESPGKQKAAPKLMPAENGQIAIPLAGFGRDYLMSISMIPQEQAATSSGLSGRVVIFELFGDEVDMYESTSGLVVTDDLPARRLLATFPIVKRQKNRVTIDFNRGMKRVFTAGWYGDSDFNANALADVLEVPQSRVFSVEDKDGRLAVRQAVQARSRQRQEDVEQRMEIRYFITPYQPGDFKPKENDVLSSRYVRFFQTMATLELQSGRAVSHIARFQIDEPVTFYYSANTPEEYTEAIRGGVLYWNRAFGKEIVRCEKAPEGVTAPSADHNVVQWVPWDSAGFAYADILVDPLTGKSMHGQAYMTSVFAISGVQRARILLRRMKAMEKEGKKEEDKKDDGDDDDDDDDGDDDDDDDDHRMSTRLLGLPLFRTTASCDCNLHEFAGHMADGLEALLAEGKATDEAMLRASQDYVRNVTAHEVGHVLGLRHNFAGSVAGNVSPKALDEWFDKYLTEDKPPEMKEKFTTSSVMEYSHFQAAVFNGCKMRTSDEVLPHDKAAIQWGYFEDQTVREKKLLFGTDQDVGTWADVQRFDYGSEPVVASIAEMGKDINGLPTEVLEDFIAAKAPRDKRDAIPLEQVNLRASSYASTFIGHYRDAFRWFSSNARSLRIEQEFPYVGPLNEDQRHEAHWNSLKEQVEKVGGIDRLGFGFLPLKLSLDLKPKVQDAVPPQTYDAEALTKKVAELLEAEAYKSFVGADGETYEFTDDEKETIKKAAKKLFEELETELLTRVMQTWASLPRDLGVEVEGQVSDDDIVAKMEKQIVAAAKLVILARDDEESGKKVIGQVDKATVTVTDFKYDFETRQAAARALADRAGSFPAWSKDARAAIAKELKSLVDSSLNINNFKEFSDSKLSRPLRDWYLEQQRLLRELPK